MIDDAPAVELTVGRERGEAVVVAREGDLPDGTGRRVAFPAERARGHVAKLQLAAGDRKVALVTLGGVDAFARAGERLAVMDLAPAAQALAIGLELRVHRPDLLLARAANKDDRNVAENQSGRRNRLIARFLEGHEGLQKGEVGAIIGISAHLAGLANDDERFGRGRQEHLLHRSSIGSDHERGAGGDLGLTAESFTFDQTDRG